MTDPVPEASVLTRSEPTEADYDAAIRTAANEMFAGELNLRTRNVVRAVVDLIWQRAQAARPVPADRSGEWPLIKALLRKAERFATEEYQRRVECHDAVREAAFIEEAKELADELFKVVVRPDPPLLSLKGEGK